MDTGEKNGSALSTLELKDKLNQRLVQLVAEYNQEIEKVPLEKRTRKKLLGVHAQLKDRFLNGFQAELCDLRVNTEIFLEYKLKLAGQLNQAFDKIEGVKKPSKKQTENPGSSRVTEPTIKASGIVSRYPNNATKMDISSNAKRKQVDFYNVLENNDATRIEGTSIHYFDSKIVSSSSSAIVYKGYFQNGGESTRQPAAIKRYLKSAVELFDNELEIWSTIRNNESYSSIHVTRLLDWTNQGQHFFLAIEWAEMTLGEKIRQMKAQSDVANPKKKLVQFCEHMAKGLSWLHSKNIVHRDIKPENVLIFEYYNQGKILEVAKITDFGVSRITPESGQGAETKVAGSENWVAPEIIGAVMNGKKLRSTKMQDIFSLGLTIHFTLSLGEHPFAESANWGKLINLNILDGATKPKPLPHPNYLENGLIEGMLSKQAECRPTVEGVLKHPLFWNWERSLEFLKTFISKIYEKKDKDVKNVRDIIEEHYGNWYAHEVVKLSNGEIDKPFNWRDKVGETKWEAFQKFKIKKGHAKSYNENSVISLLELIRDKCMHSGDLPDILLEDEHFGVNGMFSAKRYAEFFLEVFPDLITVLVRLLPEVRKEYEPLVEVIDTFLESSHEE